MKKLLSVFLCIILVSSCFVGCGEKLDLSGKEIAKLLLADERLDSKVLTDRKGFSASETETVSGGLDMPVPVTLANLKGSDYGDDTNMLDFFNSYLQIIEEEAKGFAELIDDTKNNIKITDAWVGDILLTVDAGSETIIRRWNDFVEICRRYTNANGKDVYEMFERHSDGDVYMLFVEGERYEMTCGMGDGNNINIVIENSRGYWNMFTAYGEDNQKNTQTLISTGTSAFVYYGYLNDSYEYGQLITLMDKEMNSDVISCGGEEGTSVQILAGAFTGIGTIVTNSDNHVKSFETPTGVIREQDEFEGGIRFNDGAEHQGIKNAVHLNFVTQETNAASAIRKVIALLESKGVKCRYNTEELAADADGAIALAKKFPNYYKWNGISIKSSADVMAAEAVVAARGEALYDIYESVKDAKSVLFTSRGPVFDNYDFAVVDSLSAAKVTVENGKVSVSGLDMTVSGLKVFDAGEKYTVNLALAKLDDTSAEKYATLDSAMKGKFITLCDVVTLAGTTDANYTAAVLMDKNGGETAEYTSGDSFKLAQTAEFAMPACDEEGVYTLVAYVATEDGIRVSEMAPLPLSADVTYENESNGFKIKMSLNQHKELIVEYAVDRIVIEAEAKAGGYSYSEAVELLENAVLANGYPAANPVVEKADSSGSFSTVTSGSFSDCVLRMNFVDKEDNSESFVYLIVG